MIFVNELKHLKIYNRPFQLPINMNNKMKGSCVFLLTPSLQSSLNLLNNKNILHKYYKSYFMEKNILYYVNQEGCILSEAGDAPLPPVPTPQQVQLKMPPVVQAPVPKLPPISDAINKIKYRNRTYSLKSRKAIHKIKKAYDGKLSNNNTNQNDNKEPQENVDEAFVGFWKESYINANGLYRFNIDGKRCLYADTQYLSEANSSYNTALYKFLYKDRIKMDKEVLNLYKQIKQDVPFITRTYLDINKYKGDNLFIDLSYYIDIFFNNNIYKLDKAINIFYEFLDRQINDQRLKSNNYEEKTILIPVNEWIESADEYKYTNEINPISMILRLLKKNSVLLNNTWKNCNILFFGKFGYLKCNLNELKVQDYSYLVKQLERIRVASSTIKEDEPSNGKESTATIVSNIVDKIETSQNVKIHKLTGDDSKDKETDIVDKITKAAVKASDTEEALDILDQDEYVKSIINNLATAQDNNVKISAARAARINKLEDSYLDKKINNKPIRDIIGENDTNKELPVSSFNIDSPNEEWKKMKYVNFEKAYNLDSDILDIFRCFASKQPSLAIIDISKENTSTSEDLKDTWTAKYETENGVRGTIKLDIPIMKDHKFMRLRGNDKTINSQLFRIPISKSDQNTVQIVSNYNKIFISRYGSSTTGKSCVYADRLIKALGKYNGFKYAYGNNSRESNRYELPIDYIDISSMYTSIESKSYIIYFSQDLMYKKYGNKIDPNEGLPLIYSKKEDKIIYYDNYPQILSLYVTGVLMNESKEFMDIYDTTKPATKYTYTKVSIMSTEIPLIVILGYHKGLITALETCNVKYVLSEKRTVVQDWDRIKFKDGYLHYEVTYKSSLLLNGLKECATEQYSLSEINDKAMYLDFLDLFGGRIKSDGLDNFEQVMIDPITKTVCDRYKIPNNYYDLMAYSNDLLVDNKYLKHADISAYRLRSTEIIAGYTYKAMAEAFADFANRYKRSNKANFNIKQSAVIDKLLIDPTMSDLSKINDILIAESVNSASYKGLSGMNAERAYSLDKRVFDESMINILSMSTGFAGNVGMTRQIALNADIEGTRGYIKQNNVDNIGLSSLSITEALNPLMSTKDDSFRQGMTFIQTAKHSMRTDKSTPSLITTGADMILPYITTNVFSFNAEEDGKVIEIVKDDYMIVQYKSGKRDLINLREETEKNSDGGFYITLKLDTDLKVGSTFKEGSVIAYDRLSYSNEIGGDSNDIAYNMGTLAKIAILNTDENFEDSAIISEYLSEAMASDVVIKKEIVLNKNSNLFSIVKKGQTIQEGEPLIIFQNAFDDEDANMLLKQLAKDDPNAVTDLGRIPIKSHITGWVQDIKVYRTVDKSELSESLLKLVNQYEKEINKRKAVMKANNIEGANTIDNMQTLDPTGKLKNARDSVMIEIYLKYHDKLSIGDKIVYYSANKGVDKGIFAKGKEPTSSFRPDEKIHTLSALSSINGRMVCTIHNIALINKGLIELDRKIKDMAGIPWKYLDED